jgi:hypothetical protein
MNVYINKLTQISAVTGIALGGIGMSASVMPASALTFNFSPAAGTSQQAIDGFVAAGNLWSALLSDNITVNIDIGFRSLSPGVLAEADSTTATFSYSNVYGALGLDRSSADDNTAVGSLSNTPTFGLLLNRTSNNPNGSGSATSYLDIDGDANNSTIRMTAANAKALGLSNPASTSKVRTNVLAADVLRSANSNSNQNLMSNAAAANVGTADSGITFNSDFVFDFDRSNGIAAGAFDFVGVAAHEIGHALGFISGVDILDINSPPVNGPFRDDQFTFVNTLDLYRYSAASTALGAIDWTASTSDKYFSLNRGVSSIASFATGENFGDGRQASHWKDGLGLGIMDPTFSRGELGIIRENDLRALDVIGWNRASVVAGATSVPEPSDFVGTLLFAAFTAKLLHHRRQQLAAAKQGSVSKHVETATTIGYQDPVTRNTSEILGL